MNMKGKNVGCQLRKFPKGSTVQLQDGFTDNIRNVTEKGKQIKERGHSLVRMAF